MFIEQCQNPPTTFIEDIKMEWKNSKFGTILGLLVCAMGIGIPIAWIITILMAPPGTPLLP